MTTRRRNGLTLTELLVVGTIILAVTALSIPVVKPMMESQLTKNGANMLATALNRARSRAMVTGRPCGVRFEYWPGTTVGQNVLSINNMTPDEDNNINLYFVNGIDHRDSEGRFYFPPGASLVLRQVEVPPVYTGLLGIEKVTYSGGKCNFPNDPYIQSELANMTAAKIQFGGSGPFYAINRDREIIVDDKTYALPPDRDTQYPFKVLLDSRTTMAMPVCMPRGTAVDLQFSGVGDNIFIDCSDLFQPNRLLIMFSPDGSVESVHGTIPTEPVHFLVGRWEQISDVRPDRDVETLPNYADGRNYWVSVLPQTGVVTVNQVNPVDPPAGSDYAPETRVNDYNEGEEKVPDVRLPNGVIGLSRELTR